MKLKIFTTLFLLFFLSSFNFKVVDQPVKAAILHAPEVALNTAEMMEEKFDELYSGLTGSAKPSFKVFRKALIGYMNLKAQGKLSEKGLLTIIDFSLSSNKKRMWVIDLNRKAIIFNNLVAHGRNTGNIMATEFSNIPDSNMSSLGFYVTANPYTGKHGLSLRLMGMEDKFNSTAMKRAIVMHGADYVSQEFIERYGRLGRSLGCPSVPKEISGAIIKAIAHKTCLFIYAAKPRYEERSLLLNKDRALNYFSANHFLI